MKITLAQLNYIIGDFEGNSDKIIRAINLAKAEGSSLIIFSELSVCGYPPLDLLEHRYFIEKSQDSLKKISSACNGIAAIVGAPVINESSEGKNLFNAAIFCNKGKIEKVIHKTLLPTYDVFDEYRYFEPSRKFEIIEYLGVRIALTICEDLWFEQPILSGFGKEKLYSVNPMDELVKHNPEIIINIAASPFAFNHDDVKREILTFNSGKYNLPIIYVNQVGAQNDIIFDGGSRVVNSQGVIIRRAPFFAEHKMSISIDDILTIKKPEEKIEIPKRISKIHDALILGIKDYFQKMNFKGAVIGLSGGIDSAVTAVLAVKALGKENVRVLLMPSKYSSDHSINDARKLADIIGIQYDIISIQDIVETFEKSLSPVFEGRNPDITEENIQARARGILLMAVSNKFGYILLNTSNKSEAAVGYGTLYGDMAGGISVLGDVYKTDVYQLAEYINNYSEVIPVNTIIKPPSAELRPDQKDSDSLPDYNVLDSILYSYIELRKSADQLIGEGFEKDIVLRTIKMVNANEYKRYQTPPILRVSSKAFGLGRRMPLVARY